MSDRYEAARLDSVDDGLRVLWSDDHTSTFDLVELRRACGCAACNELRATGGSVYPAPGAPAPQPLELLDAELVGSYGVSFTWNDGHATGIYTWEHLRDGCPCDECRTERRMLGRANPLHR